MSVCTKSVSRDSWHFHPCGKPATRGKYCGLHDPSRPDKVKKRAGAEARFNAPREREDALLKLARFAGRVLEDESDDPDIETIAQQCGVMDDIYVIAPDVAKVLEELKEEKP